MIGSEPLNLLKDGEILKAFFVVVDSSAGIWGLGFLGMVFVVSAYIKTESLKLTAFVQFLILIGLSHLYRLENVPLFIVMLVFFVSIVIYDIFIRDKSQ